MSKSKPCCAALLPWLRANLGNGCTAPLTGTDAKALTAAVHIIELYSYHRQQTVLEAFGRIVECMQPHTQSLAYHAIAHVMDWGDRAEVWTLAGLPEFVPSRCAFEPKPRSEERRVGKECTSWCRSRWSPYH